LAKKLIQNGEELAQNVEQLVGRLVKGNLFEKNPFFKEATSQFTLNLDRYVSGFIRIFEEGYTKFETAVCMTVGKRLIPQKNDVEEEFFDALEYD